MLSEHGLYLGSTRVFATLLKTTVIIVDTSRNGETRLKKQQVRVLNLFSGCYSSTAKDSSSYCQCTLDAAVWMFVLLHIIVNTDGIFYVLVTACLIVSTSPYDNLADEAVNEDNVSKHSNDPLLSGEDRLKLEELMALCTNLQNGVLDLEHTKTTQALEIDSLKWRVKKLEKKQRECIHTGEKIHDIDADEDITLENCSYAEIVDEVTLAQALTALKSAKVQEKGDVIKEPSVPVSAASTKVSTIIPTTDATTITDGLDSIAKAKGIVFQDKRKTSRQAPTLIVSSQQPSQIKGQDKDQRRKFFTAKRAKDKRNKPPTQAQQRKLYTTYLKNMEGYTLKQLKGFKFEVIKDMFDRAFKRVNTLVDHEKELIKESSKKGENEKESSSKRTGEELESDKSKKQKLDEKVEAEMLKNFDREDLEVLWRIVKARFKKTKPVNYMDTFLHLNLKTMFEHRLEDNLVLLVQKLLLLVLKVNAVGTKVITAERLQLLKSIKDAQRKDKDCF
ncbi:hypothetical protein Tco_0039514 [Tanacetum coccineum]